MRARSFTAALTVALALTSIAHAQAQDPAALKEEGNRLMRELHFKEALEKYDQALRLGGDPAIHYNRARTLEALGDYPRALDALEEFVRAAPLELRARVAQLDDLLADLRAHVGTLVVATVPGATVRVSHVFVGMTPFASPVRVSVGDALVEVEAKGYRPFSKQVHFSNGETRVEANLDKEPVAPVVTDQHPPLLAHEEPRNKSPLKPVAIVVGSVGVAALIAGGIFGGLAVADKSTLDTQCPNKGCNADGLATKSEAFTYATLSTIGFIAGPVLIATAVVTWLVAPRAKVAPSVGVGWVGVRGVF